MVGKLTLTLVKLAVLLFSVILHEVAHGYAAYRLGDPTAKAANRLSLNPLAHIDLFGSILLPAMLLIIGSPVLLGWARPVPFNPAYFSNPKKGIMLVGAAGPLTNFALAAVSAGLLRLLIPTGLLGLDPSGLAGLILVYLCVTNIVLGVFNLVPIPPLDGSRVVLGFLPNHLIRPYMQLERFGFIIIVALLWMGALDRVIAPVSNFLLRALLGPA